ncbi:MAG: diguanylate cyclase domain-containing protein [Nitrospirales bacterium]
MSEHKSSSSVESYTERLSRLLRLLESQNVSLPARVEDQLSCSLNQLEEILGQLSMPNTVSNVPLRSSVLNVEKNASPTLQPIEKILNCIPDGHIVTSSDGIIHMANQQAAQLFQMSQQELTGQSLSSMIDKDQSLELLKHLQTLRCDDESWQGEIQVTPNSQSPRSVLCTLSALRDTEGYLVGAHWLFWNVTERRQGIMAQEFSHEISQLVLSGMTVEQALTILCRRLVETFGYPLVWVGAKEVGGAVRILAQSGDHALTRGLTQERWDSVTSELGGVSRAVQHHKTQVLYRDQLDDSPDRQWLQTEGLHSEIVVPLMTDEQVLGVLTICSRQRNAFDPSIARWLEQLGSHISKSLFLAQNYDQLRLQGKALNYAEHAVCITNPDGKIEWVNDAYCRLSGYEVGEVVGTILPSSQSKPFRLLLAKAARPDFQGQSWKVESTETRKDGQLYTVEEILTPLLSEKGHVSNIVAILQDITSRKEAEAKIIHRVFHDPLTDLPNRVMFQDRLEQAFAQARRHQRLLAVLFIDLDSFKQINDEFGHRAGDQLLKTVAGQLSHCVRATDTVARLSGDEFTVILQDLEQVTDAQHVAQKILDCIVEPIEIDGQILCARTSIGIALFPNDAVDPEDLLRQADRAMYKAKELGGQSWAFPSDSYDSCVSDSSLS